MGKGGGALSMWIKEFTALVFTQTIQAFIYAIVISIILYGMVNPDGNTDDDVNSALGLMATFALLSVFKVEEMSKRIFGLHDTKAAPGNAMKSIAKTAFAAHLGKRVLNNLGKVTGGIGAITKSRQDNAKTKKRFEEDMADNGFVRGKDGKLDYVGKKKTEKDRLGSGAPREGGDESGGGSPTGTGGSDSYEISAADQRRMRNALRSYDDKVAEIKKQRNEGIKNMVSGVTEFMGAAYGGAAGMVIGGADGNLDEAIQGLMAGAGVGDALGQSAVNSVEKALNFAQRNYKRQAGISSRSLQKVINEYKDSFGKASVNHDIRDVDDID